MPIRTYTGIDFINYLVAFISNTGNDVASDIEFSQMNFVVNSSGSNTPFGAGFRNKAEYVYRAIGDLDFDAFPAIPDGSTISKVEVRIDITLAASATGTDTAGDVFICYAGGVFSSSVLVDGVDLPTIKVAELIDNYHESSIAASLNASDHYALSDIFDFSGAPITKAELVTRFTAWLVELNGLWMGDGFDPGSSGESSGFTFAGIRIEITYEAGPAVSYIVSPAGGDVSPGQIVTVTGPIAEEYVAIIDGKVVPIEPKIIGPEEISLEIPYPATDPCYDCFPSCPECEAAFTPCDEDLGSDDCQAAMQACLDCLTTCLEDLELAEECQESSQYPPNTTVPVVLIAGTQFSGNVMLGNFVIIVADGSGLYKFTTGQTHDELYSTSRDGTTYNVKIPNPGGKTGFFRS